MARQDQLETNPSLSPQRNTFSAEIRLFSFSANVDDVYINRSFFGDLRTPTVP